MMRIPIRFFIVLNSVSITLLVTTVVAEEGLVNHWKFDGNYKDSVGKKHACDLLRKKVVAV